jgi:hypothetical protein
MCHHQFVGWKLELLASSLSKTGLVRGAGLFSVRETRDTKLSMLCEDRPFVDAYKIYRDRALAMGREAGLEWEIK